MEFTIKVPNYKQKGILLFYRIWASLVFDVAFLGICFGLQLTSYAWIFFGIASILGWFFGKFLFVLFSGINPADLVFVEGGNHNDSEFVVDIFLGSTFYTITGRVDSCRGLSSSEINQLLYANTPRRVIKHLIDHDGPVYVNYQFPDHNIKMVLRLRNG